MSPQVWPPQPPQAGYVPSVSNTTQQTVLFPTPFAAPPIVVATPVQSRQYITVQDVTATSFRCIVGGANPLPVNWIATPAT